MSKENARGMQDDVISRREAIDALYSVDEYNSRSVKAIKQLPPIQPEPKRGKWIRVGSGSLYDYYKCSECGKQPKWDCMGDNRWKIAFTDFCPNCGCRMDGGEQ